MSDKTLKILLTAVNGLAAAVIAVSLAGIFMTVREAGTAAAVYETVSSGTNGEEHIHNYFTPNESASQESEAEEETAYVVRTYKGKVAVFREGESFPCMELDIPAKSLTQEDEKILEAGIYARSPAELLNILEDYDY